MHVPTRLADQANSTLRIQLNSNSYLALPVCQIIDLAFKLVSAGP